MCNILGKTSALLVALILLAPRLASAAEESANQVIIADTRALHGWQAWLANLYNESHILFTVFTVISIPLMGFVLGSLADLAMRCIGIDLKSRDLAEH